MKNKTTQKITKFIIAATMALCVFTLSSVISHAGVTDSKHNLSVLPSSGEQTAYTFLTEQICVFCHTPHGANNKIRPSMFWNAASSGYINNGVSGGAPMYLWNQALTNSSGYTLYTTDTMNAYSGEVRIFSLMCLSCHDGVGAMNVMSNPPQLDEGADLDPVDGYPDETDLDGLPNMNQMGDTNPGATRHANIGERWTYAGGTDDGIAKLANDHPISIDYTSSHPDVVAGGMYSPSSGDIGGLRLFRNPTSGQYTSLECSTCHDVHNQGTAAAGTTPFLAKSNLGSALCLTCHKK